MEDRSLFAIPLNTWHQHFNGSGRSRRYVAVTTRPRSSTSTKTSNSCSNTNTISRTFFRRAGILQQQGRAEGLLLETKFVADAVNLPLISARSAVPAGPYPLQHGARSMNSHISSSPWARTRRNAHGPGAHVIVLSGEGYSLMWAEGDEPRRYEWQAGSVIVPPNMWFHQHFNTGTAPARYLAFKHEATSIRNEQGVPKAWISRRLGGDQIDYADEPPAIRKLFAEALTKHDLKPRWGGLQGGLAETTTKAACITGFAPGRGAAPDFAAQSGACDCFGREFEQELSPPTAGNGEFGMAGEIPLILTLDNHGVPHRWVTWQQACFTMQRTWSPGRWASGSSFSRRHLQGTGRRSSITHGRSSRSRARRWR